MAIAHTTSLMMGIALASAKPPTFPTDYYVGQQSNVVINQVNLRP